MDAGDDDRYSRAPRLEDLVAICKALNDEKARYILIGGFAVMAYGAGRTTKDIDFVIDDSPENVARVKRALAILSDNAAAGVGDDDVARHVVVRVADEVVIDLMGRACGMSYEQLITDSNVFELEGVEIPLPAIRSLILTKRTARPIDAADCAFLESLLLKTEG